MILLSLVITTGIFACSHDNSVLAVEVPGQPENNENSNDDDDPESENMNMVIKIGETTFTATLADNETAKAFKVLLPKTFNMSELNNNEKYCSMPQSLAAEASCPGTIRNGDIMLYGSSTLVLFYKTFSTSYSYTRIGAVNDPSGLADALGSGNISVTFEQINE